MNIKIVSIPMETESNKALLCVLDPKVTMQVNSWNPTNKIENTTIAVLSLVFLMLSHKKEVKKKYSKKVNTVKYKKVALMKS